MNNKYYDKQTVARLLEEIASLAVQPCTIMEVCGTHTMCIAEYGLRELLPPQIRLVSGPGCPVCVTDASTVGAALAIAGQPQLILLSFGDMLRVPAGDSCLLSCRDQGADVRMVLSPLDALRIAERNPDKKVVFFAVGFETTAPLSAVTLEQAVQNNIDNFYLLSAHKTMPNVLRALLSQSTHIDALLCPGHVAAVVGSQAFSFVASELGRPAAICGFTPVDILYAIRQLLRMRQQGRIAVENCYARAVPRQGNVLACAALDRVFVPADVHWRGLGRISGSGLQLRPEFAAYDAWQVFAGCIDAAPTRVDNPGCCCAEVLRGERKAEDCPLFGNVCQPEHPVGACMVSGEGACAAAYKYRKA